MHYIQIHVHDLLYLYMVYALTNFFLKNFGVSLVKLSKCSLAFIKTTFDEYCLVMLFRRRHHQENVHLTNLTMSQITPNSISEHSWHVSWTFGYFLPLHKFKMVNSQSNLYWIHQSKSRNLPPGGFRYKLGIF